MDALKTENEKMQSIIAQKGLAVDSVFPSGSNPSSSVASSSPSASSLLKKSLILGEPSHFGEIKLCVLYEMCYFLFYPALMPTNMP